MPLVYGTVLIRNWSAFSTLGLSGFKDPTGFWDGAFIDFPVSVGAYRFPEDPAEPMLLHLPKVAVSGGGASPRQQSRDGRFALARFPSRIMSARFATFLSVRLVRAALIQRPISKPSP